MSIALYIEGGGDSRDGKAALRLGFDTLLGPQKEAARRRNLQWRTVLCGGRNATFDAFVNATRKRFADVVVLVVDAEDPVANATPDGRVTHLKARDRWTFEQIDSGCIHLMTECMEAWLVADPDRLKEFYGQGFKRNALPRRHRLDDERKSDIERALEEATKETQKGRYAKIRHASKLLERLRPEVVARRCSSFQPLTEWLDAVVTAA